MSICWKKRPNRCTRKTVHELRQTGTRTVPETSGFKKIPETEKWCMRLARQHGNALAAYTCRLKLYFTMGEKEKFFEVLQELKESDIIIDNETLELIRIFS